jgi:hypothetical protein
MNVPLIVIGAAVAMICIECLRPGRSFCGSANWWPRARHEVGLLWRWFHQIHHSPIRRLYQC